MTAPIKAVLVSIIGAAIIITFSKFIYIFPFYINIVVETFNLANVAASDNYVKEDYYERTLERLENSPMTDSVTIVVDNNTSFHTYGDNDEFSYNTTAVKPYCQRGESITITVNAVYVTETELWGRSVYTNVPMSFSITTTGLRYYKDLEYDYWGD